jgi:hypothetical protein
MTPNLQAKKEMTTEIFITFTSKEMGKQQVVNCLMIQDAPEGLFVKPLLAQRNK